MQIVRQITHGTRAPFPRTAHVHLMGIPNRAVASWQRFARFEFEVRIRDHGCELIRLDEATNVGWFTEIRIGTHVRIKDFKVRPGQDIELEQLKFRFESAVFVVNDERVNALGALVCGDVARRVSACL